MQEMKIVSCFSYKGGAGRSTLAMNVIPFFILFYIVFVKPRDTLATEGKTNYFNWAFVCQLCQ